MIKMKRTMMLVAVDLEEEALVLVSNNRIVRNQVSNRRNNLNMRSQCCLLKSKLADSVEGLTKTLMKNHQIFTIGKNVPCQFNAGNVDKSLKFPHLTSIYWRSAIREKIINCALSVKEFFVQKTSIIMSALDLGHRVLLNANYAKKVCILFQKLDGESMFQI